MKMLLTISTIEILFDGSLQFSAKGILNSFSPVFIKGKISAFFDNESQFLTMNRNTEMRDVKDNIASRDISPIRTNM